MARGSRAGKLARADDATAHMPGQPRRYTVTVHEGFEQGDPEWHEVRLGKITASQFSAVMGESDEASEMRRKLLRRLAGEKLTGEPFETYTNAAMERGKAMEADARRHYEQTRLVDVKRVAFVDNGVAGASPDGFVGDGGLEIKTMRPDLMIPLLEQPAQMPAAHRAQVHGGMWVCQREWWDFKVYWPRMPDFTVRITRNESYIKQIADNVERFNYDLEQLVEKIRRMGV